MSTSPYLHSILTAFSQMDIQKLHLLLKDDYSYQCTTKEIFLEKIKEIFDAHRNSDDTELLLYKGKCNGAGCKNCSTDGYRLVGNNSKDYLDLLFVQKGDDVTDIFDCGTFKTDEETGELNSMNYIYINRDDEISFKKTPEYWSNLNAALAAHNEITAIPAHMLTLDEIDYWLNKHRFTYDAVGANDPFVGLMKWYDFTELYEELKEVSESVRKHQNELSIATSQIKNVSGEETLLQWLMQYEDLYQSLPFDVTYGFFNKLMHQTQNDPEKMNINDPALETLYEFIAFHRANHFATLTKYSTYTPAEESELYNNSGYPDKRFITSLKFHLTRREEARELGMDIPLFINERGEDDIEQGDIDSNGKTRF